LLNCFAFLLIAAGGDVMVNSILGSNFMFLNGVPPGTPITAAGDWFRNPGYQAILVLILLSVWSILYIPWMIVAKKRHTNDISLAPEN
jgi:uncharacterized membrane protein YwaF